jgi:Dolichyl-phosphate-mannose-protein mannosyltransferase
MRLIGFLAFAGLVLAAIAWVRAPEYDEAYSLFLTAGHARPVWPTAEFTAGSVRYLYSGTAGFWQIAHDLRQGDVHPPLYFWALEVWRQIAGPSWFAARLLSVVFALAGLYLLARLAAAARTPVYPVLYLTLLSYGFAYTAIIARGFALAQFCNIAGVYLLFLAVQRKRWPLAMAGGAAFGAACFTNYLALFTACAALLWLAFTRPRLLAAALAGFLPVLPACAWFFLAQRHTRTGQFLAFSPTHAVLLLAKDSGAAIFGGLPLYAGPFGLAVTLGLAALFQLAIGMVLVRRHAHAGLFALAAVAPPCGLFVLGLIFGNTPIEIRYLAFATPFLALLLAPSLPRPLLGIMLALQTAAILGLGFAPATMQPQARAARQAAAYPGASVLLPFGNDGVGVPGPFIASAPDNMRILLLRPGAVPKAQAVVVTLAIDNESRAIAAETGCSPGVSLCWPR